MTFQCSHVSRSTLIYFYFSPTECINNFVEVVYDKITSTIICAFNDPLNITGKSCTVEYGNCNQQMGRKLEGSSTQESPNIVTLKLQSIDSNQRYCYNATASNGSDTIIVMGSIGELINSVA